MKVSLRLVYAISLALAIAAGLQRPTLWQACLTAIMMFFGVVVLAAILVYVLGLAWRQ